jgi:hypothetical protein
MDRAGGHDDDMMMSERTRGEAGWSFAGSRFAG